MVSNGILATASVAGVAVGEHDYIVALAAGTFSLQVDTGAPATDAFAGSVPDSPYNWVIMGNSVPYFGSYSHTVSGVDQILYEPNAIIKGEAYSTGTVTVTNGDATVEGGGTTTWTELMEGGIFVSADSAQYVISSVTDSDTLELTTNYAGGTLAGQSYNMYVRLPDREGTLQDGRITWGSNPAGVGVALGSMESSGQAGAGSSTTEPPSDVLPEVNVSDWYGDGTVSKASTLANPIRPFITMVSDNTTLDEIQVWRWMGIALLLFITVGVGVMLRGHQGITGMVVGAFLGGLVAFDNNIFPMWLLVLTVGCFIGGIIAERSPSL
jgi:hypothetical protein